MRGKYGRALRWWLRTASTAAKKTKPAQISEIPAALSTARARITWTTVIGCITSPSAAPSGAQTATAAGAANSRSLTGLSGFPMSRTVSKGSAYSLPVKRDQ